MANISRRGFINASVLGTLGAALAPSVRGDDAPKIQGFDETQTEIDKTKEWVPVSDRKIRVGIVGYGTCQFGAQFGFQNHPNVEIVAVSDLFPERCAGLAKACACEKTYESLEKMVEDDSIEAIFVATDAPSHAEHAMLALNHGKHVACAVPAIWGGKPEQAEQLLETVKKTGLKYGMFETSAFHDDLYACRKIYQAGGFGQMVYTEGEYYHYGKTSAPSYKNWRLGMPVQWYPTHATAYYVCVTGGSFTEVTCFAKPSYQTDRYNKNNAYGNEFGTEIAFYKTSEGGSARMAVSFDTPGWGGEVGRSRGQIGGYGEQSGYWAADQEWKDRVNKMNLLKPALPPGMGAGGHGGSHGHLTNDFVESILADRLPMVNVALALNATVCGSVAHQSALKDGETLKIPQFQL